MERRHHAPLVPAPQAAIVIDVAVERPFVAAATERPLGARGAFLTRQVSAIERRDRGPGFDEVANEAFVAVRPWLVGLAVVATDHWACDRSEALGA